MQDIQEQSAIELREELQHNLKIIREMSSLPVFGVGKLPPMEELMELREHDMDVVASRGNPAGQEDKCRFTGDEKFFSREKIRNMSPGKSVVYRLKLKTHLISDQTLKSMRSVSPRHVDRKEVPPEVPTGSRRWDAVDAQLHELHHI